MSPRKPRDSLKCNLISSCNDLFAMRNKCFFSCSARILKWHVTSGKFCFIHMLAVKIVCVFTHCRLCCESVHTIADENLHLYKHINTMLSIPLLCSHLSKKKVQNALCLLFTWCNSLNYSTCCISSYRTSSSGVKTVVYE